VKRIKKNVKYGSTRDNKKDKEEREIQQYKRQ
jgi:hypothetical protein